MPTDPQSIPFDRSYWVSPGRLLAGCYPGSLNHEEAAANLKALFRMGVRTCVDLTEEDELNIAGWPLMSYERDWRQVEGGEGIHHRRPIRDRDVPLPEEMKAILDLIDSEIERNRPVYVHCLGEIGRTGTVVGCWLARHGVAAGSEVLDRISELRKGEPYADLDSPQTDDQRNMVMNWRAGE